MGTSSAWARAVAISLVGTKRVMDVARAAERLLEAFALHALEDAELQTLTTTCYQRFPTRLTELSDWERDWFDRDLPPAPGRILLGGAGLGREQRALLRRGYEVVAFDPAAPPGSEVLALGYEDLLGAEGASDDAGAARIRAHAPYAAVIFGWGSFTHVPGAARRLDVLRAARQLSDGPLLMSFWAHSPSASGGQDRAAKLGKLLADTRRLRPGEDRTGDRIVAHAGYAHTFTPEELEALAERAGYGLDHRPGGFYAHATLWPASTPRGS